MADAWNFSEREVPLTCGIFREKFHNMISAAIEREAKEVAALTGAESADVLLADLLAERRRQWAYAQLDGAVAAAEASGFTPFIPGEFSKAVKEEARVRHEARDGS